MRRPTITKQLSCRQVGKVLQHYLDDRLDPSRRALMDSHLDDCRRCGMELEAFRRLCDELSRRRLVLAPESVERLRRFGARIAQDGDLQP
jgi:anti-sigma factor RsiW